MLPAIVSLKTFVNCRLLKTPLHLVTYNSSMKRTRATSSAKKENKDDSNNDEVETKPKDSEQHLVVENLQDEKLSDMLEPSSEDVKISDQKQKSKLNLKSLKDRNKRSNQEELEPNTLPSKNKVRAVVDLKMMQAELKQLEDPPTTAWEKELCSNRLPYSFFDSPCEELAQNLLGKVLVRYLDNGTILKGRIVETESYLGTMDKASHTYKNKVTPRNMPMYMPPGTIYVYMTYGMYHCFNISSQESGGYVLIKAVEPVLGLDYMELLRNMKYEKNSREKRIVKNVQFFKRHELCNSPSNICIAFVIDEDNFNQKKIYECNNLWVEYDPYIKSTTIVAASSHNDFEEKMCRYYVLGSSSVSHRDIKSEEHAYVI
ncbi:putative 3-methyladenine DNA glycosylase isoform X1 [Osmia lignaria lignaria]|uniref:putative 3-methyladenine DNA glycosylase isoform X1 n=1 Tax=Osmia lignaria lignaria TaxID=1437193 RepID=UPI00402B78D6